MKDDNALLPPPGRYPDDPPGTVYFAVVWQGHGYCHSVHPDDCARCRKYYRPHIRRGCATTSTLVGEFTTPREAWVAVYATLYDQVQAKRRAAWLRRLQRGERPRI